MPSTTTTVTLTRGSAGNFFASASLGAGATTNADTASYDTAFRIKLTIKNTPGGSVSATRGLQIDVFDRFSTTPTTSLTPMLTIQMPSQTASTAEYSVPIWLPGGQYNVKFTNLDASQGITIEGTIDIVASLSNS